MKVNLKKKMYKVHDYGLKKEKNTRIEYKRVV